MDTLLSLSDEEIEAINPDHELVKFDHIKSCYSPNCDLTISYLLGSAVVTSSRDWVGLFGRGWTSTNNYLTYQWAPQKDVVWHAPGRRRVVIPRCTSWELFDINEKFQLLYVTCGGHVIGVSQSFAFGTPEEPELDFDVLERLSYTVVESFSNNFLDFPSLDSFALSSDSGNSSCAEADPEDEEVPLTLAWDNSSLVGDFTGKSWYEELEHLNDEAIVKEYEPNKEQSLVPYMPGHLSSSSTSTSTKKKADTPVTAKKNYAIFFDEDDDDKSELVAPILMKKEARKSTMKDSPLSTALDPFYSKIPVKFCNLWTRHDIQQSSDQEKSMPESDETTPLLEDRSIELPFGSPSDKKQSTMETDVDLTECLPRLFGEGDGDMKPVPLYDVNETRNLAISNAESKRKAKDEWVKMAMQVFKGLAASLPLPYLPRPISCASDCIACIISKFMLKHYQHRLLAAEERVKHLELKTVAIQESLDAKEAATKPDTQTGSSPNIMSPSPKLTTMLAFVKKAEETIALLDEALTLSLAEKHGLEKKRKNQQSGSEKGQQTDVKVIKDASTDCRPKRDVNSYNSEEEEKDGWKQKNSRKIHRLMKSIARKNEVLQQTQDVLQCRQGQILFYQDTIKELRRNIREERRHVKAGRQEILTLRRQLMAKVPSRVAWGKEVAKNDEGISTKNQPIKTTETEVTSFSAPQTPYTPKSLPTASTPVSKPFIGGFSTGVRPMTGVPSTVVKPMNGVSSTFAKPINGVPPTFIQAMNGVSSTFAKPINGVPSTFAQPMLGMPMPTNRVPSTKAKTAAGVSPFYSDTKAFRLDMNTQIKEGKCRMCGMNFSSKIDRRLIEEHITYHLQFDL